MSLHLSLSLYVSVEVRLLHHLSVLIRLVVEPNLCPTIEGLGRRYPFVLTLTSFGSWELRRILEKILLPHIHHFPN